jgi:Predicted xylanase/chitin deacetylase
MMLLFAGGAIAALCVGAYFLMNARGVQLAGRIVTRAKTDKMRIALTLDDGPTGDTGEILAMLDELGVKCTFFLTGGAIARNMDAAKAVAAAGHQIGNHSYSHGRMIFKSMQWIENEIDSTGALIREAGYAGEIYFRPPYGKKLLLLPLALKKRGITAVTWSVEVSGNDSPDKVAEAVTRQARPGAIILLHIMYNKNEREAVPGIVRSLQGSGYEFVTVEELLASS